MRDKKIGKGMSMTLLLYQNLEQLWSNDLDRLGYFSDKNKVVLVGQSVFNLSFVAAAKRA